MEKFPLKGTTLSNNTIPQNHQHTLTTYQSVDTKVKFKKWRNLIKRRTNDKNDNDSKNLNNKNLINYR